MAFIVSSLCIVALTEVTDSGGVDKILSKLVELEEDCFIEIFHQQVKKARKKSRHDRHIKHNKSQMGDLVFLYDNKFLHHLEKFQMH